MRRTTLEKADIELRLSDVAQLFDTRDPSPFRESSLAPEAETYLLGRAKDIPGRQTIRLVLRLPPGGAVDVARAVTQHFQDRVVIASREVREFFREGRRALLIGFTTLAACLLLAWHVADYLPERPITRILTESFVILGWVSMWKPIEIFLYGRLPVLRRRDLLKRLAAAEIVVRHD